METPEEEAVLVLFVGRVKQEPIVKTMPLIFSIHNRPCSFMVYYYLFQLVFFYVVRPLLFSVFLQFKVNFVRDENSARELS